MNKRELIESVYRLTELEHPGLAKRVVEDVLNALGDVAITTLQAGGELTLPSIGKLAIKHRAARMGRNPRTGEPVAIAAKKVLKYTPVKAIKDALV